MDRTIYLFKDFLTCSMLYYAAVIRTAILCLIPLLVALLCGVGMIPRANGDSGENLASAMSTVTAAATVFWSCVIVCIGVGVYRMIKWWNDEWR